MRISKPKGYWTRDRLNEESLKYSTRSEFQIGSPTPYSVSVQKGKEFLDSICTHMSPSLTEPYSLEELIEEAKLYSRRIDFQSGSPSMYVVSKRRNDYENIVSHMNPSLTEAYSLKEIENEANKYTVCGDFKKNSPKLYSAASKRGILDQVCFHMKHSKTSSIPEIEIFNIVKSYHPDTKKLIDRRVKIKNKAYIKGFHIDIFVPSLKLGIEFDGKHYHSFKYMRKDKSKILWPDYDIRNYHKLKDDWFDSKGVKILHIKEEDWDLDKEACIALCKKFLSII